MCIRPLSLSIEYMGGDLGHRIESRVTKVNSTKGDEPCISISQGPREGGDLVHEIIFKPG